MQQPGRTAGSRCRHSSHFTSCTVSFSNSVSAWAGFWLPCTQWACCSLSFLYACIYQSYPEIRVHENICIALLYRKWMYWSDTASSQKYQSKNINLLFGIQTLALGLLFFCLRERCKPLMPEISVHCVLCSRFLPCGFPALLFTAE